MFSSSISKIQYHDQKSIDMDVSCPHREDFKINQKQLPHISPRSSQSSQETIQESTVPESILNSLPIPTDMPKQNQQRTFHGKNTEKY